MAAIGYSPVPAWVPPTGVLDDAPLELDDGASAVWAPATDGALSAGVEEVLDGGTLDGELDDWVSPDPTAPSPVGEAVEELESSPEPDASAPLLV
jgi:hypothetical protein